jgi:hypothetical protein
MAFAIAFSVALNVLLVVRLWQAYDRIDELIEQVKKERTRP